ncbi:MAG: heterodisulfide reductase-related iron-sulfur binding cluster [Candidatus Tectimicrobiota bacterium]
MQATREIYGNIVGGELVYLAMVISFGLLGLALFKHYRLWMQGRPDNRFQYPWRRLKAMFVQGLGQQKTLREAPGLLHFFVYAGFIVLFIGTLMVAVHEDLGIHFLQGPFYLFYSVTLDVFGLLCLVGIAGLTYRRYVIRPTGLDNRREDLIILLWFFAVLGSGFLVEGLRIGATELHQHPDWALWSPVGAAIAWVLDSLTMRESQFLFWHRVWWWGHMIVTFGLLTYIGYSKLSHIIFSPLNILLHKTRAKGELAPILDLDKALEGDEEAMARVRFGAGKLADFTWKQLLDLDACTRCGRCQDNCPAWLSGKPLSPKFVILDLQQHMHATAPAVLAGAEEPYGEVAMIGDVISEAVLWSCTTCRACEENCPVSIEHIDTIVDMRRNLVLEQGRMPETAEAALRSIEQRGHPWRGTQATRTGWTTGLDVPLLADNPDAEYLFWVGCTGALVDRNIQVTKALVTILQEAGVSFAILGEEETCTGDPARRLGNEYLFQMLAQQNIETLNNYGVKKIVTHCPHCLNTLLNEYPQFGGRYEVIHHSQLIARLLAEGRITPTQELSEKVTLHDACYLGRHNDIFAEPRAAVQAIPGVTLQEMRWNQRKGLCCGAGGGHAFMEVNFGRRVNHIRTEQASETGASVVATSCPFCMQMFEDGVKATGAEERMRVHDIAELIAQSLPKAAEGGTG